MGSLRRVVTLYNMLANFAGRNLTVAQRSKRFSLPLWGNFSPLGEYAYNNWTKIKQKFRAFSKKHTPKMKEAAKADLVAQLQAFHQDIRFQTTTRDENGIFVRLLSPTEEELSELQYRIVKKALPE